MSAAQPTRGISDVLAACRAEGRAALIGYLPVGYPSVEGSIAAMVALLRASTIATSVLSIVRTCAEALASTANTGNR